MGSPLAPCSARPKASAATEKSFLRSADQPSENARSAALIGAARSTAGRSALRSGFFSVPTAGTGAVAGVETATVGLVAAGPGLVPAALGDGSGRWTATDDATGGAGLGNAMAGAAVATDFSAGGCGGTEDVTVGSRACQRSPSPKIRLRLLCGRTSTRPCTTRTETR